MTPLTRRRALLGLLAAPVVVPAASALPVPVESPIATLRAGVADQLARIEALRLRIDAESPRWEAARGKVLADIEEWIT